MLQGSSIQNVPHETTPNPIIFEETFYLSMFYSIVNYNINISYLFNLFENCFS